MSSFPVKKAVTLASIVGAGVAAALGIAIPKEESGRTVEAEIGPDSELIIRHVSGKQYLRAYLDVVGVATACDGITTYRGEPITKDMSFTEAQCSAMLEEELIKHAQGVMKCTPGLALSTNPATEKRREGPRFAAVSGAYNFGVGLYCGSTARTRFNAGDYAGGCTALTWYNKAGGKVLPGLVNRRAREYKVCTEGLEVLPGFRRPTTFSTGIPPEQYQADAGVFTFYLSDVSKVCGDRPGATVYACAGTKNAARIMVLPNPCQYAKDEWFARLACHERGHHLGWPADHPYPVAL